MILRVVLIFLLVFGMCTCKRGVVSEVHIGQKYFCNNGKKIVESVKSEMQCAHFCLRQETCGDVNYIEENEYKTTKHICEVIANNFVIHMICLSFQIIIILPIMTIIDVDYHVDD